MLTPEIRARLFPYIQGILGNHGHLLVEGGGVDDHVHLLVALSMKQAVADMMRELKAGASKWIHETWPRQEFAWQEGYGAFSVSMSGVAETRAYIRNQEEHHRKLTLAEELRKFAEVHGMRMNEDGSFERAPSG